MATARGPRRWGSTLIELMVAVVMTGILASLAVPSFQRAIEQARTEQAAATLRTIWAAQRFYKLDHGVYATDQADPPQTAIEMLQAAGLLDDSLDTSAFSFGIDAGGFPVRADRRAGASWSGSLEINEDGVISGSISGHGHTLEPSFQFNDGQ